MDSSSAVRHEWYVFGIEYMDKLLCLLLRVADGPYRPIKSLNLEMDVVLVDVGARISPHCDRIIYRLLREWFATDRVWGQLN